MRLGAGRRSAGHSPALRDLADEELIQLMEGGRAPAFEVIYDRHVGAAFSLAYRMCGTRPAAEDVVQDAFLAIWRSGARYDARRGSVRSWLLGVVHNRAIDALRRRGVRDRRHASDEGISERLEAPERTDLEATRREDCRSLRGLLAELPDEQAQVVELAYFGGFTHVEIAHILGSPVGTVKGRMRLGLEKLRAGADEAGVVP